MTETLAPRQTPLYGLHIALGAKMVPFAGYAMPLQYSGGIIAEHLHTRAAASLFDTAHMGQARLEGSDPAGALERLTGSDVRALAQGRQRYSLLLNEEGGIIDDFIVARIPGETALHLVVNAATKDGDFAYIAETLRGQAELIPQPDLALIALQGPHAERALARHVPQVADMTFLEIRRARFDGIDMLVSRSGYTGEDGFELSVAAGDVETLVRALLDEPEVAPAGLGARDSLRLEAGLCLYGHDITTTTDPVAARLLWTIGRRRRDAADFPGAETILRKAHAGSAMHRVGLKLEDKAVARADCRILAPDGREIGHVTSGGYGPSLGAPIAMGYVETPYSQDGTELAISIRSRNVPAVVTALPFVPHRYSKSKPA